MNRQYASSSLISLLTTHAGYMIVSLDTSFFFKHTATTEIYTLSLHDALPIFPETARNDPVNLERIVARLLRCGQVERHPLRSEEHTSELQSRENLVCRLLLEKKKQQNIKTTIHKNT